MKRSAEDIVAIGQELQAAKDRLPHGQFGDWLQAEFEMSYPTANNFMNVAERFSGKSRNFLDLPISALYLLAAPSTPEPVREAVDRGEVEPNHAAIKAAIEQTCEPGRGAMRFSTPWGRTRHTDYRAATPTSGARWKHC